jgi:D-tagatose-1,6-bisphosphate aldolase subunit GatZ/KbaZ
MQEARGTGQALLIEATSNQVNQFGGYTGHAPRDFVRFLRGIAARLGFPAENVWIGGDQPRTQCLARRAAEAAMAKASDLVRDYVAAGIRKIHLDCSMACLGDPDPVPEEVVAARAAALCARAEASWRDAGGEAPVYVIGTEVPTPGGATEELETLAVTTPESASATIAAHRVAFGRAGLEAAGPRVLALVVQPGVEFDHHKVIDYRPGEAKALSAFIGRQDQFVYEAHSTDYQSAGSLRALVLDHFAILKVGPVRTYALRETLWGLAAIEQELVGHGAVPDLRRIVVDTMRADPQHWRGHYDAESKSLDLDLQFSLSDRIRYYWPNRACSAPVQRCSNGSTRRRFRSRFSASTCLASTTPCGRGDCGSPRTRSCARGIALRCDPILPPVAARPARRHEARRVSRPAVPPCSNRAVAAWTAREIAQQPAVWMQVAALLSGERARIDAFLAASARRSDAADRADWRRHLGLHRRLPRARAVGAPASPSPMRSATTELLSGPNLRLPGGSPTLLVSFARSGNSPESVAALELAEHILAGQVHHLAITCNREGAPRIARAGDVECLPGADAGCDP